MNFCAHLGFVFWVFFYVLHWQSTVNYPAVMFSYAAKREHVCLTDDHFPFAPSSVFFLLYVPVLVHGFNVLAC